MLNFELTANTKGYSLQVLGTAGRNFKCSMLNFKFTTEKKGYRMQTPKTAWRNYEFSILNYRLKRQDTFREQELRRALLHGKYRESEDQILPTRFVCRTKISVFKLSPVYSDVKV